MKNRFDNAIDALVKAFLGDTLAKYNCAMCAVGNIVAHANNCKITADMNDGYWQNYDHAKWALFLGFESKKYIPLWMMLMKIEIMTGKPKVVKIHL